MNKEEAAEMMFHLTPRPDPLGSTVRLIVRLKDGRILQGVYDEVSAALRVNFCRDLPSYASHRIEWPDECRWCERGTDGRVWMRCWQCEEAAGRVAAWATILDT